MVVYNHWWTGLVHWTGGLTNFVALFLGSSRVRTKNRSNGKLGGAWVQDYKFCTTNHS